MGTTEFFSFITAANLLEFFIFLSGVQFVVFGFWYLGIRRQVEAFQSSVKTLTFRLEKSRVNRRRR